MTALRQMRELPPNALAPLRAASTAEGFRFVERLAAEWDGGTTRYDAPGELLLGAYDGTQLVAVGGLTRDPYGATPEVGRLRHIYVMPDLRRRGVGRRLVAALEAAATGEGRYRSIVLRTDTIAAARFYEALGYAALPAGGTATHWRALDA